ncbi:MAG: histidine phosphatase family protein [Deltaproteobacteria bacterium]|nr:histidine phosphatase family protein [Deltaproteobacteria bacterium]
MKLVLVRHAKPAISSRIFYGQMDVPLSEEGRIQAVLAGNLLNTFHFSRIISSDLSRCMETAAIICDTIRFEGDIEAAPGLREVDFGDWTGLTWEQIEEHYAGAFEKRLKNLPEFRPPNGETLLEVSKRAWTVMSNAIQNAQGDVLIIGHGGVNRLLIAKAIGLPLQNIFNLGQDHCCVNIIECYEDGNMGLLALNLQAAQRNSGKNLNMAWPISLV